MPFFSATQYALPASLTPALATSAQLHSHTGPRPPSTSIRPSLHQHSSHPGPVDGARACGRGGAAGGLWLVRRITGRS